LYATPNKIQESNIYSVFQVRVRPGSYRVQGNTLAECGWKNRVVPYDTNFGADEIEWLVEDPENIVITGLMIRKDNLDMMKYVEDKYKTNKSIFKIRPKDDGVWYWNSNSNGKTLGKEGPWTAYNNVSNIQLEKAYKGGQMQMFLGRIDTDQGELIYFVNFDIMEQIRCNDNLLRRKIKREPRV